MRSNGIKWLRSFQKGHNWDMGQLWSTRAELRPQRLSRTRVYYMSWQLRNRTNMSSFPVWICKCKFWLLWFLQTCVSSSATSWWCVWFSAQDLEGCEQGSDSCCAHLNSFNYSSLTTKSFQRLLQTQNHWIPANTSLTQFFIMKCICLFSILKCSKFLSMLCR